MDRLARCLMCTRWTNYGNTCTRCTHGPALALGLPEAMSAMGSGFMEAADTPAEVRQVEGRAIVGFGRARVPRLIEYFEKGTPHLAMRHIDSGEPCYDLEPTEEEVLAEKRLLELIAGYRKLARP